MRYITVPAPVRLINPVNDEPLTLSDGRPDTMSFARSCRCAIILVSQEQGADALTLLDLRRKTDAAVEGACLEVTDDEWNLLVPKFKRPHPQLFGAAWAFSAESHQRAWLDAPTTK